MQLWFAPPSLMVTALRRGPSRYDTCTCSACLSSRTISFGALVLCKDMSYNRADGLSEAVEIQQAGARLHSLACVMLDGACLPALVMAQGEKRSQNSDDTVALKRNNNSDNNYSELWLCYSLYCLHDISRASFQFQDICGVTFISIPLAFVPCYVRCVLVFAGCLDALSLHVFRCR